MTDTWEPEYRTTAAGQVVPAVETLRIDFERFHQTNPQVWDLFLKFTGEVMRAGMKHYSVNAIFERIRWHVEVGTRSADGFKLNNNHRAFYARMFERTYPQYAGFFRTRVQRSEQ